MDKVEIKKESVDFTKLGMATDDLLQGKPFVLETPSTAICSAFKSPNLILTDARTPTAPTQDLFLQGPPELSVMWELDPVPAEGRQLRQIRLCASANDRCRLSAEVKFSVRDAKTKVWRDVTENISDTFPGGRLTDFRLISVTVPEMQVVDFDAFRMTNSVGKEKKSIPRLIEVDVVVTPTNAKK